MKIFVSLFFCLCYIFCPFVFSAEIQELRDENDYKKMHNAWHLTALYPPVYGIVGICNGIRIHNEKKKIKEHNKRISLLQSQIATNNQEKINQNVAPIYLKCSMSEGVYNFNKKYITYYKLLGQTLYDNDGNRLKTTFNGDEIIATYFKNEDEASSFFSKYEFTFNRKSGGYQRKHYVFDDSNKLRAFKEMTGSCIKDNGANYNKYAF